MTRNTFFNKNTNHQIKTSGFGLIELLISISIMILVTSIVLSQHNAFNSSVLLKSQAYEIALQAREVQLNAVSIVGDGTPDFRKVYGLHFNKLTGANDSYKIFQDAGDDNFYNGASEQFGKQGKLDSRFIISGIRTMDGTTVDDDTINDISVIFERPNFDARFFTGPNSEVSDAISSIEIDIKLEATGEVRIIEITKTGQISVI